VKLLAFLLAAIPVLAQPWAVTGNGLHATMQRDPAVAACKLIGGFACTPLEADGYPRISGYLLIAQSGDTSIVAYRYDMTFRMPDGSLVARATAFPRDPTTTASSQWWDATRNGVRLGRLVSWSVTGLRAGPMASTPAAEQR
jgi:hypothetical protein